MVASTDQMQCLAIAWPWGGANGYPTNQIRIFRSRYVGVPNTTTSSVLRRKMSTSTCVCVALLIAIVAARPEVEPVKVNYYAESLCPDCIALSRGAMNLAVKEVRAPPL